MSPVRKIKPTVERLPIAERSAEIAHYYGFTCIDTPTITKDDLSKTKKELEIDPIKDEPKNPKKLYVRPEEKVAILRTYGEKEMFNQPQPVLLYYFGHAQQEGMKKRSGGSEKTFTLEAIGTPKSIGEAIILKTAIEILKEEGYSNLVVNVNSAGDKESMTRFCREIGAYFRKHIEKISQPGKQLLKKDPFDLYEALHEHTEGEVKDKVPNPISFLTEPSRVHFKEVLEFLETLSIPYRIEHTLVCNKKIWSQTVFEIIDEDTGTVVGTGVRYNHIAKKIGLKKDAPAVGLTVAYKPKKDSKLKAAPIIKPPLVSFVQLGFDAKLKSLIVIEMLREAKIPMTQALGRDKISVQMQTVETSKIPYTIIMGQREALENSVIFRDMSNRSQEVVTFADLPAFLEKIKKELEE